MYSAGNKNLNVYKNQMQPNKQQLMLPEEWRGMGSVNCTAFLTTLFHHGCLYNVLFPPSISS